MCGICGMLGRPAREVIEKMAAAMVHRGPDAGGLFGDDRAALGFRRLSIIDVNGGHQPLENEDGWLHLVMNGEIYNHLALRRELEEKGHRFRTASDAEVILHLYEDRGPGLVDALNGIFAFALWDPRRDCLLLARDHHGVKPLYYSEVDGRLLFASELKALISSGLVSRELDREAVAHYLTFQAVPPPMSILRDVRSLPPGSLLVAQRGTVSVVPFWTPPQQSRHTVGSVADAKELVLSGLRAAVRRQLMSERPLGVFLSGGVDSSALVALAARAVSHRLETFSVGFVGPDEKVLTEWPWAKMVASRYGTEHHEVVLTERMFLDALPHALVAMDQPTADGLNSYWVSWAASRHVVVALSGTGGDELLLGYPRDARLLQRYAEGTALATLPAHYLRFVARALGRLRSGHLWPSAERLVGAAQAYALLDDEFLSPSGIAIASRRDRDEVLAPAYLSRTKVRGLARLFSPAVPAAIDQPGDWLARLEQRAYLSAVLLRDIDAMSMAHSLEVRVPFLDPEYCAQLARIPWEMKLRDGVGKWVLKEALRPLLPQEVLFREKMGFSLPYCTWMRRSVAPMIRDVLSPANVRRRSVFDPAAVQRLLERFYAGDDTVWRRVWTAFVLEGWAGRVLDAAGSTAAAQAA